MTDERLSGPCVLSVHRKIVKSNKVQSIENVINAFGKDRHRLQFLFKEVDE